MNFSFPGYDIKENDRICSTKGSVIFLYKSELILNKVYDNNDFNIITNNETLAIELEPSNKITLTLATIYCPDGKPDCNSISLEKDPTKLWCRIKSSIKPKTQKTYPTLNLDNKTTKTNANKAELFTESVERNFGIEGNNFDDTNLREINQSVVANPYVFTPLDSTNDGIHDKDDNHPISLEKDPTKLWCRIKSSIKPRTQKTYPTLNLDNKTTKTNANKAELFTESVERNFGIEGNNFDDTNLREINQSVVANPYVFTPLDSTNDGIHDKDDNHPLVADVGPKKLITIVKLVRFDL